MKRKVILFAVGVLVLVGCQPDKDHVRMNWPPAGTPLQVEVPANFPAMPIPANNPFTEEGVALGRYLFYEERLSGDNTMSCASCHSPEVAFTDDGNQFSTGIAGIQGTRNSMALINLAWDTRYFWDGRVFTLEDQILQPVRDPVEMHSTWPQAMDKLQAHVTYPALFQAAFGTSTIDSLLVAKAIAQFLRTMISGNSPFDRFQRGEGLLSFEASSGLGLWDREGGFPPA
ncbi:MAG TPA: cytochrome-c peroxidase, partial [Flavobacteriales bacterium]|nr:cytochrome-c peroxidase [Flavobacteriales bacterium]